MRTSLSESGYWRGLSRTDDGEHGGVPANGESEGENRGGDEERVLAQDAHGIIHILENRFQDSVVRERSHALSIIHPVFERPRGDGGEWRGARINRYLARCRAPFVH